MSVSDAHVGVVIYHSEFSGKVKQSIWTPDFMFKRNICIWNVKFDLPNADF